MFCEVGAWKDYEELEESLTLDELFLTYEAATERQTRLLKTVAAAWGGSVAEENPSASSDIPGTIVDPKTGQTLTLFGYREVKSADGV